jgi:hypothetical protein
MSGNVLNITHFQILQALHFIHEYNQLNQYYFEINKDLVSYRGRLT